ncbi:MAG: fasciclin domain-containing protein [Planctomycetota bacterium]
MSLSKRTIAIVVMTLMTSIVHAQQKDIVDTAVGAGSFKTLVAAVKAADLVDTLKSPGPFTVFAPTDEAFAKLPAGTLESLLKPENKDKLTSILTYHVVAGNVMAKDVVKLSAAETVQGSSVKIATNANGVMVDNARVVKTDIACTNGTIHVIDSVILPPAKAEAGKDIVDTAVGAGSFNTLVAAVKAAGLVETLKGDGPFTVFAPTDEAFAKLPAGTIDSLLKPENKGKLTSILTYHVVPGKVLAKDVVKLSSAKTVEGSSVQIAADSSGVRVDDAKVVTTDIECSNGVIHVIDSVILPGQKAPAAKDLVDTAVGAGSFNTLVAAVKAAGLVDTLKGKGPLTVFAPTDAAFAKLPAGTVDTLLKPENKQKLIDILTYHVVPGNVSARDAVSKGMAKTVQGGNVAIGIKEGRLTVNKANVVNTDIKCTNGTIHVIDEVILPSDKPKKMKKVSNVAPRHLIEQAIAKGVPMYNSGHHAGCCKVYSEAMTSLANHGRMPMHVRNDMSRTLQRANNVHSHDSRAWMLRHGLDRAYAASLNLR